MSNFKQRKIRNTPPKKPISEKTKRNLATVLAIVLIIALTYYGGVRLIDTISSMRFAGFLSGIFGKELAADSSGRTNVLILGVGGVGHEGENLTDTVMIASLNQRDISISMLSVPRDLHVKSEVGANRLNEIFSESKKRWDSREAIDYIQKTVSDFFAIPIHYTIKVDFKAFEKIVDAVGGIDIFVDEAIDDPLYPKSGTFEYAPFYISKGFHHLDGETALKYVRSRKTSSDFDRSKRQQQVLVAIKNKAMQENSYSRKNLIQQLYYSLSENVETNLSLRELLSLADFGARLNTNNIKTANLNDDPAWRGGFLYTPSRELFGGAFVFLPAGDSRNYVQKFAYLVLYGPKNFSEMTVAVLNGTKTNGLAYDVKAAFARYGVNFAYVGNAKRQNLTATSWYFSGADAQPAAEFLQNFVPGQQFAQIPPEYAQNPKTADAKIILELGSDSVQNVDKLDIFRNVVYDQPTAAGSTTPASPSTGTSTK